jgi:hypothetical protein
MIGYRSVSRLFASCGGWPNDGWVLFGFVFCEQESDLRTSIGTMIGDDPG